VTGIVALIVFLDVFKEYRCLNSKVKLSLSQAAEAYSVMRRRGSHIFLTIGSQMAVRSVALYRQEDSWYSLF
jgi:hypothetical protein